MAPEQLSGAEVTVRSDIYALGLVLYEIFTGQRALEGRNLAELINRREQSGITPPSALVKDLDPEIEQGIMRCLRPEPEARPGSALAVAAALPGGDPLAAALAAGETPSPAMVAAAGMSDAMNARHVWIGRGVDRRRAGLVLLSYQRILLINRVPMPKPPDALVDRAQEALANIGYSAAPRASAAGFAISTDYLAYVDATSTRTAIAGSRSVRRPESIIFWYRTSPRRLIPWGNENTVSGTNPPLNVSGMTLIVLDASGRLAEFHAVPEPVESPGPNPPADWTPLFDAAASTSDVHAGAAAVRFPPCFADERAAWEGHAARPAGPHLPGRGRRVRTAASCSSGSPARGRDRPDAEPAQAVTLQSDRRRPRQPDHAGPDDRRRAPRPPQPPAQPRRPRRRVPRGLVPAS